MNRILTGLFVTLICFLVSMASAQCQNQTPCNGKKNCETKCNSECVKDTCPEGKCKSVNDNCTKNCAYLNENSCVSGKSHCSRHNGQSKSLKCEKADSKKCDKAGHTKCVNSHDCVKTEKCNGNQNYHKDLNCSKEQTCGKEQGCLSSCNPCKKTVCKSPENCQCDGKKKENCKVSKK